MMKAMLRSAFALPVIARWSESLASTDSFATIFNLVTKSLFAALNSQARLFLIVLLFVLPAWSQSVHFSENELELSAPIDRWDDAIPLGNGLTGGLLWGSGNTVRLSLDRADLWDLRVPDAYRRRDWNYSALRSLVAQKDEAAIQQRFEDPYEDGPYPTKLPGARLEISFNNSTLGLTYAIVISRRSVRGGGELAIAVASSVEAADAID